MRLGFHYHVPAVMRGGTVRMPGYLGLFVDSLARRCDSVTCFLHSAGADEIEQMDHNLKSSNVHLVDLGLRTPIPSRTCRAWMKRGLFREWLPQLDVMLVRASTPLLPIIASVWEKPLAVLLVSDAVAGIENLPQPAWRKRLILAWARWYQKQELKVACRSLTFVNSRVLYEQMRPYVSQLIETRTTTLSEDDFFLRDDTCTTQPIRILYAGRMSRTKGLIEIVETLSLLVTSGIDVVLDLVGMLDRGDPILQDLAVKARTLGVEDRVRFHGYKPAGQELLKYYRRADIYMIASQASSEGFPRTIWEAMASSVPVVATQVGSIPAFISNSAVLVPPKSSQALAEAVSRLIADPLLRQKLIQKGLTLARGNTLENRAQEMVSAIETWLSAGHLSGGHAISKSIGKTVEGAS